MIAVREMRQIATDISAQWRGRVDEQFTTVNKA
jgi:hypothetical protein